MSADSPVPEDPSPDFAAEVLHQAVDEQMEQSYIDYAMSVIAGRALPDARDGLKPVHRRILYAMHEAGVTSRTSHRKSSSVVGETMGDYHPHGDSAIYDTLAKMAQPFTMRHMLVDGQGNFGSVDGDPPAAMRYTESRMAPLAEDLLGDLDKDAVDFQSNYDDRTTEPEVLPAKYPNLLVNGSTGIAVGMSTKIPPHNLGETIDAATHLIDNPEADVEDLMEHLPGPDFPTGAKIVGRDGIYNAYSTVNGTIRMRASFHVEEDGRTDKIVITELPYQENKSRLIERIADKVKDGEFDGVSDIRDESDRDGIRIVVSVKQGSNTDVVKNTLQSDFLEKTFGVINLALVDGEPRVLSLKQMLQEYLNHRRDVVRRRTKYDLGEAEERREVLEGRLTALDHVEDVVDLIQNVESRDDAKAELIAEYDFSDRQADHIVRMQLGSLTSLEREDIEDEYESVRDTIERLEGILNSDAELDSVIKAELQSVREDHANERRTEIIEDTGNVQNEDLIPQEDILITFTDDGYLKRMPVDEFRVQNRGGKGVIGMTLKDGDSVDDAVTVNTHDHVLFFTDTGDVHERRGFDLPEMGRQSRGAHIRNVLGISEDESVVAVTSVPDLTEADSKQVAFATRDGTVKRTSLAEFQNIQSNGIRATGIAEEDALVDVAITSESNDLMLVNSMGKAIRFDEQDVRLMGRSATGVNGMEVPDGESVIGLIVVPSDGSGSILTVTENGYGKRTAFENYPSQSRGGKGLIDIKTNDRNGSVADVVGVTSDDTVVLATENAQVMRTDTDGISSVGRNTQGVTVISLNDTDSPISVTKV